MAIGLAANHGVAAGRGLRARVVHIDAETQLVTIERGWVNDDHRQHLTTTNSGKKRTIPLGVFGERVVSYTNGDVPFSARTRTTDFGRLAKGLGVDATFHGLRHFAQSQLVAAGIDPVTAARRAGQTPEVMMATYAHGTTEQDALAAEVVGRVLMRALEQ